jgi:hypothetical protein
VCLEEDDTLCLGVSPGPKVVEEDLPAQLKNRTNNELLNLDGEKLRVDVKFAINGTISYSLNNKFCYRQRGKENDIYLSTSCSGDIKEHWKTIYFLNNSEQISSIEHRRTKLCMTVMRCDLIYNTKLKISFCDKDVLYPERKKFRKTAMIRLWPCWYSVGGNVKDKRAQTFKNRLDCAVGCDANLQDNDVCDPACNNDQCLLDNGNCISKAPTPPTESPTNSPSINPTNNPSESPSINPTRSPSSVSPTNNPSFNPTHNPSNIPSSNPSNSPSNNPTRNPTRYPSPPTNSPSYNPSLSPSLSPSVVLPQPFNYLWLLLLLLLLLLYLLCCIPIKYVKNAFTKKEEDKKEEEEEIKDLENSEIVEIEIINQNTIKPENMPEYMQVTPPPPAPPPPALRTINKEIDIHNKVWEKKVIGKTVSFTRNKDNYGKADIPAEHLDRVVNELKERSSLKKI